MPIVHTQNYILNSDEIIVIPVSNTFPSKNKLFENIITHYPEVVEKYNVLKDSPPGTCRLVYSEHGTKLFALLFLEAVQKFTPNSAFSALAHLKEQLNNCPTFHNTISLPDFVHPSIIKISNSMFNTTTIYRS